MYKKGVFIGRFQPFHMGHMHLVKEALGLCDELIIFVGSVKRPRSPKDPFTFEERRQMIIENLSDYDVQHKKQFATRVHIVGLEDTFYDDGLWAQFVRNNLDRFVKEGDTLALLGHRKDESSYYLDLFPDLQLVEIENYEDINATYLREHYFAETLFSSAAKKQLCESVLSYMQKFQKTHAFKMLKREAEYIDDYKTSWADAPWAPFFVTTDAVVLCSDHILLVKRANHPGQGLWALPGGFLEENEWVQDGLIRELTEETCIEVSEDDLFNALKTIEVFDHPKRALIGRVITHVGVFDLGRNALPKVHPDDDAAEAKWFPMASFQDMSEVLHDDHYYIVQTLIHPV